MNIGHEVEQFFSKVIDTLHRLERQNLIRLTDILLKAYRNERTVFVFGNGGSASTASHLCGDFIKGISFDLDKRFKAVCLNDNIPALMAIANDISYDDIFVEQLKNYLKKDDVVIGISCSGNSNNVIKALEYANKTGAVTVAFCGFNGGRIKDLTHLAIHADINDMEVSEDIHLIVAHCLKQILIKILRS